MFEMGLIKCFRLIFLDKKFTICLIHVCNLSLHMFWGIYFIKIQSLKICFKNFHYAMQVSQLQEALHSMSSIILQNSVPGSVPSSAPVTPRSTSSSLLVPGSTNKGMSLCNCCLYHLSCDTRKLVLGVLSRSNTNQLLQPQQKARSLKYWI